MDKDGVILSRDCMRFIIGQRPLASSFVSDKNSESDGTAIRCYVSDTASLGPSQLSRGLLFGMFTDDGRLEQKKLQAYRQRPTM